MSISMSFTALGEYGNYQHKLTIDELARHKHNYAPSWVTQSQSNTGTFGMVGNGENYTYGGGVEYVGENTPFDIIHPSICVFMWKRIS